MGLAKEKKDFLQFNANEHEIGRLQRLNTAHEYFDGECKQKNLETSLEELDGKLGELKTGLTETELGLEETKKGLEEGKKMEEGLKAKDKELEGGYEKAKKEWNKVENLKKT